MARPILTEIEDSLKDIPADLDEKSSWQVQQKQQLYDMLDKLINAQVSQLSFMLSADEKRNYIIIKFVM